MKILLLDHSQYITGGLPKTIEVAESLAKRGHMVTLLATSISDRFKVDHFTRERVEYILAPSFLWGRYRNGADIWDVLNRILSVRNRDIDLIHGFDCRPTVIFPSLYLKKRYGCHLFLDWDDLYSEEGTVAERSGKPYQLTLGRVEALLDTYFRKYADGHIVVSEFLKSELIKMNIDSKKIMVNHYGSKYTDFEILNTGEARQRIGLPSDKFVLAYAGSIFKEDERLLYRALNRLPGYVKQNMVFMVIGTKFILNYQDLGIAVLRKEHLPDKDFILHLSAANVFILPYRTTVANMARWPSKFSDYCAIGRPIISTPISDLPYVYNKYKIGIMTQSDSEVELANGIRQLYEEPDKAQEMGIQAKMYAQKELRLSLMAEKLEQFYTSIRFCYSNIDNVSRNNASQKSSN